MHLERFDALTDSELTGACHAMYLAGAPADDPVVPPKSERVFAGWLAFGWNEDSREAWLARDEAGEPVGWCALGLPRRDNRHRAHLAVLVSPPRRRQGIGTAMLTHAAARARAAGRSLLVAGAREGSAASAFFRALGGSPGLTEVHRVLLLADLPDGHLARLRAQAGPAAAGYSLECWEGLIPDSRLTEVAAVYSAEADMPLDPGEEAPRWDAARVRESQQRIAAQGLRCYAVAARHDASGELAGLTQLAVDPARPDWGMQELTAVTRPHRGHRLGLLLKVRMLELLGEREPGLRFILTGNADSNRHMIAINEALGFRECGRQQSWRLDLRQPLPGRTRSQS
jgi:RimJ/RimL family protein N-acetyltransferase